MEGTNGQAERESTIPAPATALPAPLQALDEERSRMVRIMRRLGELQDPSELGERADLAHELVRSASRYQDVMRRVVAPALSGGAGIPGDDDADHEAVVAAMATVLERTSHVDPRNAHGGDPQGLEDAIGTVVEGLAARLVSEDRQLPAALDALDAEARERLGSAVAAALPHASEHPRAGRTAVGRALRNVAVRLDTAFEDVATPHHPGSLVVDDPAQEEAEPADEPGP